jgi:hypothetical protein
MNQPIISQLSANYSPINSDNCMLVNELAIKLNWRIFE